MKLSTCAAVLAVAMALPVLTFGQAISGDLVGTVVDATGSGIPKATVNAENDATGVKLSATTDGAGAYRFTNLAVGSYTVSVSAPNFGSSVVKNVQLQLNNVVTQNFTLAVGATGTTVEVTEGIVPLDTTTAQVQNTYDTRALEEM